ncbi:MAG: hypothetical protein U0792_22085 [Gemmataceae bacterium]
MAVHSVRCPCLGHFPECKLCSGSGFYSYEVGPRGWLPFQCPSCNGTGTLPNPAGSGDSRPCPTCEANGSVDPGYPPHGDNTGGLLRRIWKIFFGG